MQTDAFATTHFRQLVQREDQHLAVFTDHSHGIAFDRLHDQQADAVLDVQNLFAGPRLRHNISLGHDKAVARRRCDQQFAVGIVDQDIHNLGFVRQIDHQAERFAHPATTGQVGGGNGIETPVRRSHQQFVGGLRVEDKARAVAIFELQLAGQIDVAGHRADPAHLRTDHGDWFALDHRFDRNLFGFGSFGQHGATCAARIAFAKRLFGFAQLFRDAGPLKVFAGQQVFQSGALFHQAIPFGDQLHLFETAQGPQAHVQDRFGLNLGQGHGGRRDHIGWSDIVSLGGGALVVQRPVFAHQRGLGVVIVADDVDHAIKVQERNDQAFQHLKTVVDLFHPVRRAAAQYIAAEIKEGTQHFLHRTDLGRHAVDQNVHVQAELDLEVRVAEQHVHQNIGVHVLGLRFKDHADVFGAFVADIGKDRNLLGLDQFGQPFDQLGFLNLIGDLGHDNLVHAAAQILDRPFRPQAERSTTCAVGLRDVFGRLDQHAACREIRTGDVVQQRVVLRVRRLDQMQTGIDQFGNVVRRNVRRHAHSDPAGTVCQKVREGSGQNNGFFQRAVIVRAEIDSVFVQPVQHRLGHDGQARFGVTRGRRVIAIDVAEVTLTVHQRIANGKVLRQTRHRVIDRGVAVRVIVAHHVAGNFGRLPETARRRQAQFTHRVQNTSVNRL